MTSRARAALLAALFLPAFLAVRARTAATSVGRPVEIYAAAFGGRVPVPAHFKASARRLLDEGNAPGSVVLYAYGTDEQAWAGASRLDHGGILVEILPVENAKAAREKASRLGGEVARKLEGLRYPGYSVSGPSKAVVYLLTPKHLVRLSSARWTGAFDAVVRGYKDAA